MFPAFGLPRTLLPSATASHSDLTPGCRRVALLSRSAPALLRPSPDALLPDPSPSLCVCLYILPAQTRLKISASSLCSDTARSPNIPDRLLDALPRRPTATHISDSSTPLAAGLASPILFAVSASIPASLHPLPTLRPLHPGMPALDRQPFVPTFFECFLLVQARFLAMLRARDLQGKAEPPQPTPGRALIYC